MQWPASCNNMARLYHQFFVNVPRDRYWTLRISKNWLRHTTSNSSNPNIEIWTSLHVDHTRYRRRLVLKHEQVVNNSSSRFKTLEVAKSVSKSAVSRCYAVATGNEGNLITVARFKSRLWCSKGKPISSLERQLCWHTTDMVTIWNSSTAQQTA